MSSDQCRPLVRPLLKWFGREQRDLPWRRSGPAGQRDSYQTMVSEFMLQQTQVSRVLEKFEPFLQTFPTLRHLAKAPESAVLAAWSGLGYYRRARLLHAAAHDIVNLHDGKVPADVETLKSIRGIGPYTAGAIASIAFDRATPLVDGNVSRVLLRVFGRQGKPGERETDAWTWQSAQTLIEAVPKSASPGAFNEALMELGATVCTPKAPRCGECPLRLRCEALKQNLVDQIPTPKDRAARSVVHIAAFIVPLGGKRKRSLLVETRSDAGLFANLVQPPTLEFAAPPSEPTLRKSIGAHLGLPLRALGPLSLINAFTHTLTHRELRVTCYLLHPKRSPELDRLQRRMITQSDLPELPLSNLHKRLLLAGFGHLG